MPDQPYVQSLVAAQLDSFKTSQLATVQSCREETAGRYSIQLSETILYPEGGGQPADIGCLLPLATDSTSEVNITDVQRQGTGVLHFATQALAEGTTVEVRLDWSRRFDHMQMHTGQHLLSAVVDEVAGADTTSWEMHPFREDASSYSACIDLSISSLKPQQMQAIEERCNRIIQAARPVSAHILHEHEHSPLLASSVLRGQLPSWDKVKGQLRLLEIEGVDVNACGGTHLRNTAQLQLIKLVGQETARGGTRLSFLAGGRAIRALGASLAREARLNKVLGCGVREHEASVARLQEERKQLARARKGLLEELAGAAGQSLSAQLPSQGGVGCYHREGGDLAFLSSVAAVVEAAQPEALVLLTASLGPVSGSRCRQGEHLEGCFLLIGPPDAISAVGQQVAENLAGKGGGRGRRYQGKGKQLDKVSDCIAVLHHWKGSALQ